MNKQRTCGIFATIGVVGALASFSGCSSPNASGGGKREEDRMAIRMEEMQKQRDDYKSQVDQLGGQLAASQRRTTELTQQNQKLMSDLDAMRRQQPQPTTRPAMNK
jgi:chromosome segregation ATPase